MPDLTPPFQTPDFRDFWDLGERSVIFERNIPDHRPLNRRSEFRDFGLIQARAADFREFQLTLQEVFQMTDQLAAKVPGRL